MSTVGLSDHLGEWVRIAFIERHGRDGGGQVGMLMEWNVAGVMLQVNSTQLSEISGYPRLHFYPWQQISYIELEGEWEIPGLGKVGRAV